MPISTPRQSFLAVSTALLTGLLFAHPVGLHAQPADAGRPGLTRVAGFDQQVTGVAVAKNGRVFVNFPRWQKDVPVSVAEVMKDGSLKPYPDAGWNAWSNLKPLSTGDHWVCVQSVTVDPQCYLWVVDPAAPGKRVHQARRAEAREDRPRDRHDRQDHQDHPFRPDGRAAGQLHERRAREPGRAARPTSRTQARRVR